MSGYDQWTLEECITHTINAMNNKDVKFLREASRQRRAALNLHNTMGRWIRNECALWEHGTNKVVADIVREYKAGNLRSESLDRNEFTHEELPFDLANTREIAIQVDCELSHADNCSSVIIEAIVQRIRDERG